MTNDSSLTSTQGQNPNRLVFSKYFYEENIRTYATIVIFLKLVPTKGQHIMISYQWDCQDTIIQVKDKLRSAGFNVWIDVEEMRGSTLESMASAVEHCTVFVMAISRKYFESPNCRAGKS